MLAILLYAKSARQQLNFCQKVEFHFTLRVKQGKISLRLTSRNFTKTKSSFHFFYTSSNASGPLPLKVKAESKLNAFPSVFTIKFV